MRKRIWFLDCLKGIAILLVMLFHFVFDLQYFFAVSFDCNAGFWKLIGRTAASLFIVIAGFCFVIVYTRVPREQALKKIAYRSLTLAGAALLITMTSFIFMREGAIVFGILHFLATAPFCVLWCMPSHGRLALLFLLTAVLYSLKSYVHITNSSLAWLGFEPAYFNSYDHFPLIPWLAVYLIGVFLGLVLYKDRSIAFPDRSNTKIGRACMKLGQHSLILYLMHQPIFFVLLGAVAKVF